MTTDVEAAIEEVRRWPGVICVTANRDAVAVVREVEGVFGQVVCSHPFFLQWVEFRRRYGHREKDADPGQNGLPSGAADLADEVDGVEVQ